MMHVENQNDQFCTAYGQAVFYAHLIEDLVALHIYECGYFHINGYSGCSSFGRFRISNNARPIRRAFEESTRIKKTARLNALFHTLHLLRKIRNKLTHAFIPQVGSDFAKEEGVDQIIAMLENITTWERLYLQSLKKNLSCLS